LRAYPKRDDAFRERFSIPMSESDMFALENLCDRIGAKKTTWAREKLLKAIEDAKMTGA
jgi:hypothetical protein